MGREFELKYVATPDKLGTIQKDWEDWITISMETTYFDTADGALHDQKCTLRQRMENGISVCTMKTPATGFGRGEWDVQARWNEETAMALFTAAGRESIPFEKLKPVCGARFIRRAKLLELTDCTVEIALDEGVLLGGGRETPLCELEVELKDGNEESAALWAQHLASQYDLQSELRSKFSRASALAKGE